MLTAGLAVRGDLQDIIDQVKQTVDCQLLIPADREQEEFSRYVRIRCLNPEHTDENPTMLVYKDGWNCSGCSTHGDAIDLYKLFHPDVNTYEAAEALLANPELQLSGEATLQERPTRTLDPDQAVRNHLALVADTKALAGLMAFGFTPVCIQHWRLGYAEVLARLLPNEYELAETAPDIEWLTIKDQRVPYQRQMRYAVPVFVEGKLRQILYRKSLPDQLGAKIQMERDCGAHMFGHDNLAGAELAVIVEGYGDALVCWQYGFVAVTSTNGAGHWSQEWSEELGNVRRLYVVGDADEAGQKMVKRIKKDLRWARPVQLPWKHGSKMDVRDLWLAGFTKADFVKLLRQADVKASFKAVAK